MVTSDKDAPIGIFDSGLGGISVLRKMVRLMPNERYIYYGDSANAPYGEKTDDEVFELTKNVFEKLLKKGVKGIVIACNTATSVAEKRLQELYPDVPIAGIEPAVRLAAEKIGESDKDNRKRIAVMATAVTLRRPKYLSLKESFSETYDIVSIPCPEIVRFVEADGWSDEEYTADFQKYLINLFEKHDGKEKPFDAVVLGCTHFPFVSDFVRKAVGPQAVLCDGSDITSANMQTMLKERDILAQSGQGEAWVEILNSAGEEKTEQSWALFKKKEVCV